MRSEIQSAALFHRVVVTLQLLELTRGFVFTVLATLATPPIKNLSAPNIDSKSNALSRFTVGSIRFFVIFFLVVVFFFDFMLMPVLILAFIAVQTVVATTLSLRAESLAVTRFHPFSANTLSAA